MKRKILLSILTLTLLFSTSIMSNATVEVDKSYEFPLNVDAVTQTFANGDGTYTTYLETNHNASEGTPGNYNVPEDKYRYGTGRVVLSDNIEIVSTALVSPTDSATYPYPSVSVATESGKTVVNWTLDFGMTPVSFYAPNPAIPFLQLPHNPRNTISITYKLKNNIVGTINPIEKANLTFLGRGHVADEQVTEWFWLNGINVTTADSPTITTTFYKDKDLTQEAEKLSAPAPIYVKYQVTNPNDVALSKVAFSQDGTLTDVKVNSTALGKDLTPGETTDIQIAANGTTIITGKITTDSLSGSYTNVGTVTLSQTIQTSPITAENIANAPEYILTKDRASMGNAEVEPKFSPGGFYGDGQKVSYFYLLTAGTTSSEDSNTSPDTITVEKAAENLNPAGEVTKVEKAVDTGDHSNAPIVLIIAVVSAILLLVFFFSRRKKKSQ